MTAWLLILWLAPAVSFGALTFFEGEGVMGGAWDRWRIAGLVGCLFWPVTLPVFLLAARRHHRVTALAARAHIARRAGNGTLVPAMLVAGWLLAIPFTGAVCLF